MKTPDEIKMALEHCSTKKPCPCCPMWDECKESSSLKPLWNNALAYIQQLEAERDAAVKDCSCFMCYTCADSNNGDNCNWCTSVNGYRTGYVWRGVQKED